MQMKKNICLFLSLILMAGGASADEVIREWRVQDDNYQTETFRVQYGDRIRLEGHLFVPGSCTAPGLEHKELEIAGSTGSKVITGTVGNWSQGSITYLADTEEQTVRFRGSLHSPGDAIVKVILVSQTNLEVSKPVFKSDGSLMLGYKIGPRQAYTRDYVTADLYYATGPSRDEIIWQGGHIGGTSLELAAGLNTTHWKRIPRAQIPAAPRYARYVVAIIDQNNRIPEPREDDNVAAELLPNMSAIGTTFDPKGISLRFGYANDLERPLYSGAAVRVLVLFTSGPPAKLQYNNVQELSDELSQEDNAFLRQPSYSMRWVSTMANDTVPIPIMDIAGYPITHAVVVVDPENAIAEFDEADNIAIRELPDLRLLQIPGILNNLRWPEASKLLTKWFSAPAQRAQENMDLKLPVDSKTISWAWLLDQRNAYDDRHIRAYREIIDPTSYETANFKRALKSRVRKLMEEGGRNVQLAPKSRAFPMIHRSQLQKRTVYLSKLETLSKPIDRIDVALGNYAMYSIPVGTAIKRGGAINVTITHVLVYVLDSFDFEDRGDTWFSQQLGFWKWPKQVTRTPRPGAVHATNETFSALRTATGIGGDFLVATEVRKVKLSRPVTITW